MVTQDVDALLDQLIRRWSGWDTSRGYYLATLAPAIVRGDSAVANLTADEQQLVDDIRSHLNDAQWGELPKLLGDRQLVLVEQRQRREQEASERAEQEEHERARLIAEKEAAARRNEAEQIRLEREREQLKRQRQRDASIRRQRSHALRERISIAFEQDFLTSDAAYKQDADREVLASDEYQAMRVKFVQSWAARELAQGLDEEQAAAVAALGSDVRVTARAGSGKTHTLVTRAIFLVKHCRVSARSMLLLAFNKRAASEMRERLESALDGELPHVMTFHALAYALVHPDENLVYDDPGGGSVELSRVIQDVIDDHLGTPQHAKSIRSVMLGHFREDWEAVVAAGFQLDMEEFLVRRRALPRETLRGNFVKSHGEKVIANALFEHGVEYQYEANRRWNGVNYRPDFTIKFPDGRGGVVIEYFGMVGDTDYDEQADAKREYWATQQGWTLLEYFPQDVAPGYTEFVNRFIEDLRSLGATVERIPEEEIWKLIRKRAVDRFTGAVRTFVSRCRKRGLSDQQLDDLVDAHTAATSTESEFLKLGQSIHSAYIDRLAKTGQEDFDGLMWRAVDMLNNGSTRFARDRGSELGDLARMRHVLIDEFQDFSQMFFGIVSGIRKASRDVEFFCVGDDWQAINSFAGSDLRFFNEFENYFEHAWTREIRTNYRSPAQVVKVGNAVMRGRGSTARPHRQDPGVVWICDLERFQPTAVEQDRHQRDEITPAVLRLVQHFLGLDQEVVLLSRRNGIAWYVHYLDDRDPTADQLERFLAQIRAHLPEEDARRVTISTAHKYKGLERKAVVVLDAVEGSYPLIHPTWTLLRIFGDTLSRLEEEERRLFYVAVTRSATSLCLVTEKVRTSPYLSDAHRQIPLGETPWQNLPPVPSLGGPRIEMCVSEAFEIKDDLKQTGFKWKPQQRHWSRSYSADAYSEDWLTAKPWYSGKVQVEVRSDTGEVIRRKQTNAAQ